ncbi:MAG: hypothetical protein MK291_11755 [Planctomycetes bacterium]|nr:hypothetical protein [Planctomycetota bacterium]
MGTRADIKIRAWRAGAGLALLVASCGTTPAPATPSNAVVIAHRGASGYLPEHTLEAYTVAWEMDADFLEPDLVMCRDGHLICSHDLTMTERSNAALLYPDLADSDGKVWIKDLFLAELRMVEVTNEEGEGSYRYATLEELLGLVQLLSARTGEKVGLIPELKAPAWHRSIGLPMEGALMEALARGGYLSRGDPVVIQCFDRDSLQRMRAEHGCTFPLVLCLRREPLGDDLGWAAEHCEGVAPHRKSIEDPETGVKTELITRAHELGLSVFPYTFGDEQEAMRRFIYQYGVEGVFTDYPDKGVAARGRP